MRQSSLADVISDSQDPKRPKETYTDTPTTSDVHVSFTLPSQLTTAVTEDITNIAVLQHSQRRASRGWPASSKWLLPMVSSFGRAGLLGGAARCPHLIQSRCRIQYGFEESASTGAGVETAAGAAAVEDDSVAVMDGEGVVTPVSAVGRHCA